MLKAKRPPKFTVGPICHCQQGFTYQRRLPTNACRPPSSCNSVFNVLSAAKGLPRVSADAEIFDHDGHGSINMRFLNREMARHGHPLEGWDIKRPWRMRFHVTGGEFGSCMYHTVNSLMCGWSHAYSTASNNLPFKWSWIPEIVVSLNKSWDIQKNRSHTTAKPFKAHDIVFGGRCPAHLGHWISELRWFSMHLDERSLTIYPHGGDDKEGELMNGLWYKGKQLTTRREAKKHGAGTTMTHKEYVALGKWMQRKIAKERA